MKTNFAVPRLIGNSRLLVCGRVLASCSLLWAAAVQAQSPSGLQPAVQSEYVSDRILIRPKADKLAALSELDGTLKCKALRSFDRLGRIRVVSLPRGVSVQEVIARYQRSGFVEFAEPDYLRRLDALLPNDPKFVDGTLWGLNNYGQGGGTPHADIDAPDAWSVLNSASNIVVAVLDTGVRYTHEDLAANMWTNSIDGTHGTNAIAGTTDPSDDNGHGTLMAGVIGAVGNNGTGVVGVAWKVRLMACKCFNNLGVASDSAILACMDYAMANGAQVISASFDSTGYGEALSNSIFVASQAGIIFVASAGNNSANVDITPHYPACFQIDNIISVAYSTRNDGPGSLSNYGATNVDLFAPGDQIYSTFASSDSSYYPPGGLGINVAGTSFAAAYVSGACALMLARYPADSYQVIISRLFLETDPVPAFSGKSLTGGRLNLFKALNPPIVLTWLAAPGANPVMRVSAGPNRQCIVQSSSDMANWNPVFTNTTSISGTFDFSDSRLPNDARRCYRALSAN